jgi:hypothetical protein
MGDLLNSYCLTWWHFIQRIGVESSPLFGVHRFALGRGASSTDIGFGCVPPVYFAWASLQVCMILPARKINSLRVSNVAFSSIPAPTKLISTRDWEVTRVTKPGTFSVFSVSRGIWNE